jgi:hypothetical protein
MRKELEPDIDFAKKIFPEVKELIEKSGKVMSNYAYNKLEKKLHELSGKDISKYDIEKAWDTYDPHEDLMSNIVNNLSVRICLPDPKVVPDITKEEVIEIIKRLRFNIFGKLSNNDLGDLKYRVEGHLHGYFHKLLEINLPNYKREYFNEEKVNGEFVYLYSVEELAEKIFDGK